MRAPWSRTLFAPTTLYFAVITTPIKSGPIETSAVYVLTMTERCAFCGCRLCGPQHVSSLYGSQHILCAECGDYEERAIEERGTNDLPGLLKAYGSGNFVDARLIP